MAAAAPAATITSDKASTTNYLGLWNEFWHGRSPTEENATMLQTSKYLNEHKSIATVEDWGCGAAIFRKYLNPTTTYVGIDGSNTGHQSKIADLCTYTSQVDAVYMQHVLEHNWRWKEMLAHVLESFTKRAVIVIFTPWHEGKETEKVIAMNQMTVDISVPDLALSKSALLSILDDYNASHRSAMISFQVVELVPSKTLYGLEHVLYLEK